MAKRSRNVSSSDRSRKATRSSPENGPSGSRPEEDTTETIDEAIVVSKLLPLKRFCGQMQIAMMSSKPVQDEQSPDVIDTRNDLLVQLQITLLPKLSRDVSDLLESSEPEEGIVPQPNLRTILQIIHNLDITLHQIQDAVAGIWPSSDLLPIESHQDVNYGLVKSYRCRTIGHQVAVTLRNYLVRLFERYDRYFSNWLRSRLINYRSHDQARLVHTAHKAIIGPTAEILEFVDELIAYITRSDYDIFQHEWKSYAKLLDNPLLSAIERLNVRKTVEEQREGIIRELRASRRSRDRFEDGNTSDRSEEARSPENYELSDIHLGDREPRYNPLNTPDRRIIESITTLGKLLRILIAKLSSIRGNPPFILGEMSSADITYMKYKFQRIFVHIFNSLCQVCKMDPITRLNVTTVAEKLRQRAQKLVVHIDHFINLLDDHLVYHSASDPSSNIVESHFSNWQAATHLAVRKSINVINEVESML
ncbi:hypothetical protein MJO28_013346 [Puccinia striiformis f. sp. tritici]|uniref:Uncharacterized protein n=1 Tax=Puccinia striiformis f. sp. tritici TaxID=168172 RepID=A0ACC0DYA7_9BASI|nr:hypothetical protein MJO28_013346 [Puccinia striiformis f. sp. tritici]